MAFIMHDHRPHGSVFCKGMHAGIGAEDEWKDLFRVSGVVFPCNVQIRNTHRASVTQATCSFSKNIYVG